ncbi:Crp/Fnr family transcriptional regulator [Campylobacter lari]|uniref:Crp/Fnr family transcriptional regulator n=1 Tax=Campylobacter lari TaxID=201 RepID=UPI000E1195AD|nr:Crp/Fnr family transcriptional regulator [Campylobacter lari]EAK0445807.1 Crp/Fnr family transcriptional regulator [Campylobacter lari]MBT0820585.1 Crp/Fnr family transcriptional regulator [Campylobacter lari]SUX05983.1 Crp/Fnr family transcriptional regulator [Campylobacter lari]
MENFLSHFEIEKQDLKLIQEHLQIINIEKDFKVNDKCLGFIKILKGELRAFILTPNAKEITLFHLKENDECVICSECNMDGISYDVFIQSTKNTSIAIIPSSIFQILKEKYPKINNYVLSLITKRFNTLIKVLEQALFMPLSSRICDFLKENASNNTLKITHEALANHLGSAREAVSRILKELEKEGKIKLERSKIILISL